MRASVATPLARLGSRVAVGALACWLPALASSEPRLLRTAAPLDEPRGYCIDIAGFGPTLRLEDPLQAHTCKYGEPLEDQLFEPAPDGSAIRASEYDRCLTAAALEPGAALQVRACANTRLQRWTLADGRLRPEARTELCAAVPAASGEITGTPPLISPAYRRQNLALERCSDASLERVAFRWSARSERPSAAADVVRDGMTAEVAAALAAFGHEFDGDIARQTAAIYAPVPRVYDPDEITIIKDLAYGSHERQHVDVHTGTVHRSSTPVPVVVVFHGGGLVGGSRTATANVADYFASIGYVGVNGGYRLAPGATWPEGARDVGAAVTWLREHVGEYGGDPERIFVVGISTGAFHAATYVFRPELMPTGTARAAGAVLVSGPYTFDFATPSPGELAYFGKDSSRWPEMVVIGHVSATDIPVLLTTAEWDNPRYTGPFSELFAELVLEHHVVPRYYQSLGHNHSSQLLSVGTNDTSVSARIVDFIEHTPSP